MKWPKGFGETLPAGGVDEYKKNILLNYAFRLVTIGLGILNVRVSLGYLGANLYGLWVTISSIISWMNSGDFGIGNGLRNELSKAYSLGNEDLQKSLVHTAFSMLSRVSAILLLFMAALGEVFFRTGILDRGISVPFYITTVFFCINLVLGVGQTVAYSFQKSWICSCVNFAATSASIIVVVFLDKTGFSASLVVFAVAHGLCTTFPNLLLLLYWKRCRPGIIPLPGENMSDRGNKSLIMGKGLEFFALQLCNLVLGSTDNTVINYLLGSEKVTDYSVIAKVYDTGSNLFAILLVALWSAVTFHSARGDYGWIKKRVKNLLGLWCIFSAGVVAVSMLLNRIVSIWLGEDAMQFDPQLTGLFAFHCMAITFASIFVNVLNGMGDIRLQLVLTAAGAAANIPLSVFFAAYCGMGIMGVKLATVCSVMPLVLIMPIQAVSLIRKGYRRE